MDLTPEEQAVFDALSKDVAESRKALEYRTKQLAEANEQTNKYREKANAYYGELLKHTESEEKKRQEALLKENDRLHTLLKDAVQRNEMYGVPFGGLAKYGDLRTKELRLMKAEVINLLTRLEGYMKELEDVKAELQEVKDARLHASIPE